MHGLTGEIVVLHEPMRRLQEQSARAVEQELIIPDDEARAHPRQVGELGRPLRGTVFQSEAQANFGIGSGFQAGGAQETKRAVEKAERIGARNPAVRRVGTFASCRPMQGIVGLALECADRAMDVDSVVTLVAKRSVLNDDVAGVVRDVDGVCLARNEPPRGLAA
jgi:hypothetical protein